MQTNHIRYFTFFVLIISAIVSNNLVAQPLSAVTPKAEATLASSPTLFQWNIRDNAINYKFELASDSLFSSIIYQATNSNLQVSNPITLIPNNYFWRVIALYASAPNDTSLVHKFNIFSPTQLSGLKLWLKADSVELTNNKVSKWTDLSGNNNHVLQSDTNYRPIKALNQLNGNPTVQFDGINDYLDGGDILNIGTKSQMIYTIAKSNHTNGSILSKSLAGGANNRFSFLYDTQNLLFLFVDNVNRSITYNTAPINTFQLISTKVSNISNSISLFSNNILMGSNTYTSSNNFTSTYNFLLGAYNNNSGTTPPYPGYYLKGDIAEIIIFDTLLTVSSQNRLSEYLSYKYSLPVNLGYDIKIPYGFCDTTLYAGTRFSNFLWNTGETTENIKVKCATANIAHFFFMQS